MCMLAYICVLAR